ncbi:MAG: DUF3307 domain-containing protein [Acidobacteriota bacterium]
MQDPKIVFLALLVAHLLADFPFQTASMVEGKKQGHPRAYVLHGGSHLLCSLLLLGLFLPSSTIQGSTYLFLLLLVGLHLLTDWGKERLEKKRWLPIWTLFLLDQFAHLACLVFLSALLLPDFQATLTTAYIQLSVYHAKILATLAIYLTVTFGGGYLIRFLLTQQKDDDSETQAPADQQLSLFNESSTESEQRLGMYIGWLERILVLTALAVKSPTTVGFIIATKSIVRFKKMDDPRFAEYFLLGTFLSIFIALLGGLLLLRVLWGEAALE